MGYEEYIWGDNEGYKFRTFNRLNFSFEFVQTWRDFSSLVAFVMLIITYSVNGTFNLVFLTNWGLHFAFFSLVLNYQASNDQKQYPDKVTGLMFYKWRLAVLLFEVSVCIQVVITILFWSLLWKSPKEYTFKEYFGILKHSLPCAFMLIEFLMQKWVFKIERICIVIVTATLYMLVNFTYVKMTGFPIYPILPWNNIASVILVVAALIMLILVYMIFDILTYFNETASSKSLKRQQAQYIILVNPTASKYCNQTFTNSVV